MNAEYDPTKNIKLGLWDYYVDELTNNIYFEAEGTIITAVTDEDEFDIVLIWQAQKNLMFKLFHANRASEYDGSNGTDPTKAYTRLIGVYKF